MQTTPPEVERFWSNVDKSGGPDACWPWQLSVTDEGYGATKFQGRTRLAHRVAYELTFGPLTPDQIVRHFVCDNPRCCNPSHHKTGTHADNVADRVAKGRSARGTKNGRSKLDEIKVAEIWKLLGSGVSAPQIAKRFSVDPKAIREIRCGKIWAWCRPLSPQSPHAASCQSS